MHGYHAYCSLLRSRCLVFSIPRWRESHGVTRPNNGCERDYAYSRSSNGKKIKIIRLQLVAKKNIIPRNLTAKSKLKLSYLQ